jgi:hypothetical protein
MPLNSFIFEAINTSTMQNQKLKQLILFIILLTTLHVQAQSFNDRHSSVLSHAWLSDKKTIAPNSSRGSSHWIMYDMHTPGTITSFKIWNINTPGHSDAGIKDIVIDYSIDGINWIELLKTTIPRGTESTLYEGFNLPIIKEVNARAILITSLSNYGNSLQTGFAEIKIGVKESSTTPTYDIVSSNFDFDIWPNVITSTAIVKLKSENTDALEYEISNIQGQKLITKKIESEQFTIDVNNYPNGQYFLTIKNNDFNEGINITKEFTIIK